MHSFWRGILLASGFICGDGQHLRRSLYILYALPYLRSIDRFVKARGNSMLAREISQFPHLLEAIYRPYVNSRWRCPQRLRAIEMHYRILGNPGFGILDIAWNEYFDLLESQLEGHRVRIVIDRPPWLRLEGQLALSIFLDTDRIYSLAFSLGGSEEQPSFIVGGVQGSGAPEASARIKQLTKMLHGMRPRDYLLDIFKMLATELGVRSIYAVNNRYHRTAHRFSRGYKHADYDRIWEEHGGSYRGGGFYALSSSSTRRGLAEISAKKRSAYRKRYAHLDTVAARVRSAVSSGEKTVFVHEVYA
ncbi:MAG TPA: DUF535 family protein [Steroidobacteraceae bacterium]|nr:DUF535 family protein [Steroidobacteraceae bacterium]